MFDFGLDFWDADALAVAAAGIGGANRPSRFPVPFRSPKLTNRK